MIGLEDVRKLLRESDQQTLTLYLDVNPAEAANQVTTPTWRIWLKNALHEVESGLPRNRIAVWREIRERVDRLLESYRPQSRSLAIFVGPKLEQVYPLPIALPNRLTFGPPLITPLLWAIDVYEPYLIAMIDRTEAHLLIDYLGRPTGEETETLRLDSSDWRRTTVRPSTSRGVRTSQGSSYRDDFDHRVDEHVHRFWHDVSTHIRDTMQRQHASTVVLAGSDEATHAVRNMLPDPLASAVTAVLPAPPQAPNQELLQRAQSAVVEAERHKEAGVVDDVINLAKSGGRAALGKDAVMSALQEGRVETIIAAWPPDDEALLETVAHRATENGIRVELVHGTAAEKLRPHDGLAAMLYYPPPSAS